MAQLLTLLIVLKASYFNKATAKTVRCQSRSQCGPHQDCNKMLGLCLKQANVPLKAAAAPRAQSRQCPCGPGEYCHEKFNMCLPTPILPVVTTRASSLVRCKSDDDCSGNKYCHKIWNFCLEIPQIPTSVTRKTSRRQCTSDANCTSAEYCHDFFGCVQSRGFYCQLDQDCQSGQYCHNMTRVCLRTLGNSTHNGDRRPCVAHDDCGLQPKVRKSMCIRSRVSRGYKAQKEEKSHKPVGPETSYSWNHPESPGDPNMAQDSHKTGTLPCGLTWSTNVR
ncbi:predicted protein [Nematostella vectensis]|uniref:Dickkopf N-terminal cysteine-rich domain-containing protein n=1 Tax=Nematostella vectensis TaxID=45351 RepID=A7RRE2_NEMVE|nr:predicted protein [Nematostella vectensis]|eukprot:XP_001637993.1 predicted protein [Nematostella vectensis]